LGIIRKKKCVIGNGVVLDPWALVEEIKYLKKQGIEVNNKLITVNTKLDHRICMSSVILSLITGIKMKIKNFETVNTSFPGFISLIRSIGGKIEIKK